MTYLYESYQFTGRPPMVRIMRNEPMPTPGGTSWMLTLRAAWPWTTQHTLDLGDDLMLDILPHVDDAPTMKASHPYAAQSRRYGIIAYGRVYALVRKWGATMPIDLADPRVVERLHLREAMEAMS